MESVHDWLFERPENPPGIFSLFSLLLFSSLCLVSALFLASNNYWWWPLFGVLVGMDLIGMLASVGSVVAIDRSVLFLTVVITEIAENPSDVFLLTLLILGLVVVLDFSFFLRRVDGTNLDRNVFARRLKSYAYTVLPAALLTYLLLFVYSQYLGFSLTDAVVVLGLSSVGTLIIVYAVVRFLLSFHSDYGRRIERRRPD